MKNREYWQKRFEELEDRRMKEAAAYYRDVEKQFRRVQNRIERDIERWYQRLADNHGISYAAAKRLLNKKELAEFQWTLEEYIKKGKENAISPRWLKELENASAKVHITHLEGMKTAIQQYNEVLFAQLKEGLTGHLSKVAEESFYRNAYEIAKGTGIGRTVPYFDSKKLEIILNQTWAADGTKFSDRIWNNKQKLVGKLHTELTQSIIRGEEPDNAIKRLAKEMKVSEKQAGRLIMTETAAISSAADLKSYQELGIKKYQILATLDNKTSLICQDMDHKVFDIKDYRVGMTAPPFHPYCRTTTIPYFEDEFTIGEQRAAKDEETRKTYYVPAGMSYQEWKEKYVEKINHKGLFAGRNEEGIPMHQAPKILEKIDINDKTLIKLKLEEYEQQILKEKKENAIVITNSGEIIQCFGTLNAVYPNLDLGKKIINSYITHNHPIGSNNEYSFSDMDIKLFVENKLIILRGIDEKYIYELRKDNIERDEHKDIFSLTEEDGRHEMVIEIAEKLGIGYRRWKHGK